MSGSRVSPSGRTYYAGSTYYSSVPSGVVVHHYGGIGAFAAGTMVGTMIHPWGGYYYAPNGGVVYQPFSFWNSLLDLIILVLIFYLIYRFIRFLLRRRSY